MKKLVSILLVLFVVLGLTACSDDDKNFVVNGHYDSNYSRFYKIGDMKLSYDYIKSRGIIGVKMEGRENDVFMFPFYTSNNDDILYSYDTNITNTVSSVIQAANYNPSNIERIYYALCSGYLYYKHNGKTADDHFAHDNEMAKDLRTKYGDDYFVLNVDDIRYASQVALHLFLGNIYKEDLVRVDEYTIGDEVFVTHSKLANDKEAEILYKEMMDIIDYIVLNLEEYANSHEYITKPKQIGNGFNIKLPLTATEEEFIVPISGNISFEVPPCMQIWHWMNDNNQLPEEVSLKINSNSIIPIPSDSGIYMIKICDENGNPCDDKGTYKDGVLTINAEYVKIILFSDGIDSYNSFAKEYKDSNITFKTDAAGLTYLNINDSFVNSNLVDSNKNPILKMVLPKYNQVTVDLLNISFGK